MSIYPDEIRNGAVNGLVKLLLVDGEPKIMIGPLGMNPETFIEDALIDNWGMPEIMRVINTMLVSYDLRDDEYNQATIKVAQMIPKIFKARELKKAAAFKVLLPDKYNVGLT